MTEDILQETTVFLFNRSFDEELSDTEEETLLNHANDIISAYGWKNTFQAWNNYLHTHCKTPESAINFANWFWFYRGQEHPIPNPHQFLAYFYYQINNNTHAYDEMDILDSLATTILPRAGYREADLYLNPYYLPKNDRIILAEVEKLQKQNG